MKASVMDVLMYLFDNYIDEDIEISPDQESLKSRLREAGFGSSQVDKAFDWLEGLALQKESNENINYTNEQSLRLFNDDETGKLDTVCRGFLLYLEQTGVLGVSERELVIDRVMALETDEIDLHQLKWVVLMVLFNQPDKEAAVAWMEDIVMEDINTNLH